MKVEIKMPYCIGCIHCVFDAGHDSYAYSELTWDEGEQPKLYCIKKHWHVVMNETTRKEFSEMLEKSRDCPDVEERLPERDELVLKIEEQASTIRTLHQVIEGQHFELGQFRKSATRINFDTIGTGMFDKQEFDLSG